MKQGKVFESNGVMLQSALGKMGLEAKAETAVDDAEVARLRDDVLVVPYDLQ